MTKVDRDGIPLRRRHEVAPLQQPPEPMPALASAPSSLFPDASDKAISVQLRKLCEIEGGYFKARRPSDSADLHLTWTWTIGPYAQKYVYVRVTYWELEWGLSQLLRKLVEVEEGARKPSPDKYLT